MDYFQGVVTEFLRAKRSQFVNTEYMINLDEDGTYLKGRHLFCDAVAIDFSEQTVHLCEVTYAEGLHAIGARLQAWSNHWGGVVEAIHRDSALTGMWTVIPRVFVPRNLENPLRMKIEQIKGVVGTAKQMPSPIITALEDVLPWRYRSWNGTAFIVDG